jgi:hypothetical protein
MPGTRIHFAFPESIGLPRGGSVWKGWGCKVVVRKRGNGRLWRRVYPDKKFWSFYNAH